MAERDERLKQVLRRLIETLDYGTVSFEELGENEAFEAALQFDEAYLEACELLGMELPEPECLPELKPTQPVASPTQSCSRAGRVRAHPVHSSQARFTSTGLHSAANAHPPR